MQRVERIALTGLRHPENPKTSKSNIIRSPLNRKLILNIYLLKNIPYIADYCKRYYNSLKNYHQCDVLIDMTDLKLGRRMAQITAQLYNSGYSSCLKVSLRDYVRRRLTDEEYSHVPLSISRLYTFRNKRDPFLFTVCHNNQKARYRKALIINQNMTEFKERLNERFFFPILMHPNRMIDNDLDNPPGVDCQNRRIGILFIGNTEKSYEKHTGRMHELYGLYARREVVEHVASRFPEHVVRPESEHELLGMIDTEDLSDKIVIIDKFRVNENYFSLYRKSRFHLWTPGFFMPYCHNTIESMACGAIPLYQSFPYYPGMIEGYNCLSYQTFDEMDDVIERVLEGGISPNELDLMGKRTRELYDTHFSKKAIKQKIDDFIADEDTPYEKLYICSGAVFNKSKNEQEKIRRIQFKNVVR